MSMQPIKLVDPSGHLLGIVQAEAVGDHYGGTLEVHSLPAGVRALFDEFEEIVNGQMFSFLDDIQGRIAALKIRAVFEDGRVVAVRDLQIFPTTADVSFQLEEAPLTNGPPAVPATRVRT